MLASVTFVDDLLSPYQALAATRSGFSTDSYHFDCKTRDCPQRSIAFSDSRDCDMSDYLFSSEPDLRQTTID
mgnify:CR=1 FL=1